MTGKAALCKALLKGEVLSIMVGFKWFSITNVPREIGRSVERAFNVRVSRTTKEFTSRYGQPGSYVEYRLNRVPDNAEGIKLMEAYVREQEQSEFKSIVRTGPKKIHVKENEQKEQETKKAFIQSDLFG